MNKQQQLYTIFAILKSPNQSLREICYNENNYLLSTVIIIALGSIFTINMANGPLEENVPTFDQFGYGISNNLVDNITSTIFSFLDSIVLIVIIFLIGKKMGGIGNFKKIFAVISHCSLPFVIGGIIATGIFLVLPYAVSDVTTTSKEELSAFQHSGFIIYYGVFSPFALWSFIITIKAIKIPNGFGTGKAVGILLLSALISYVIWIPANLIFA